MSWRDRWRRDWPEYEPRPKAARLSAERKERLLASLVKERDRSPVLTGLRVEVRARRGRFYLERDDAEAPQEPLQLGRITPLAGGKSTTLLLEVEYRSWKEIERGGCAKVMRAVAGDRKGRFHGLGALDASLRDRGTERQVLVPDSASWRYADGADASVQEVLYHRFGLPLDVIAEPSGWYELHRSPAIVDHDEARGRVLVAFSAMDWRRGEQFGGRCLYARRDGEWVAYTVKPSASDSIRAAEAWLQKRGWDDWG